MDVSLFGLNFIKQFEGFSALPYQDGGGKWTIGYGHTAFNITAETPRCTEDAAEQWLRNDLQTACGAVNKLVEIPLVPCEFDALTCLVYNIGIGNFQKSKLLQRLNSGDKIGATKEWREFDLIKGVPSAGLEKRREKEIELFLTEVTAAKENAREA